MYSSNITLSYSVGVLYMPNLFNLELKQALNI